MMADTWSVSEIVDCHHHLWDLNAHRYPWLQDNVTRRVCGDYEKIRRDYLIDDFVADVSSVPLVQTVHVQAEFDHTTPVTETKWLNEVAGTHASGFPHAIVAYADFRRDDVSNTLAAHCEHGRVVGIRQMLHEYHVDSNAGHVDLLNDPKWQQGFSQIKNHALSFDLQVYPVQVDEACALIEQNPDVQFVLCHMAQPRGTGQDAPRRWSQAVARYAAYENVAIKISGIGMFVPKWTLPELSQLMLTIIDHFGTDRCMLASNFPVDGMMTSYENLWRAYESVLSTFTPSERDNIFSKNARRIYQLKDPTSKRTTALTP